jgi:toluene monooxygenase system ferredoxin subunit
MATWTRAGTLDDVWEGEMFSVRLGSHDVLLCNIDGAVVAYEDRCPHLANPLSRGAFNENVLVCAAHEWTFDARSGRGVNPEVACLRRYAVRVEGDEIFVNVERHDS